MAASNLTLRVASAAILAPLAFGAAYVGSWPFAIFWTVAAVAVMWEWTILVAGPGNRLIFLAGAAAIVAATLMTEFSRPIVAAFLVGLGVLAALVFAPSARRLWIAGGVIYAGALALAPIFLRDDERWGFLAIVFIFVVVWTTDILGYFGGRALGGPKLLPAISPKKTWSGAICGMAGVVLFSALGAYLVRGEVKVAFLALAVALSVVSQAGDLFESWIKRLFGAKDSGNLIPGHGGVMDRLDGFWSAALVAAIIGIARGGFEMPAQGLLLW